jgi:hypothetical protein
MDEVQIFFLTEIGKRIKGWFNDLVREKAGFTKTLAELHGNQKHPTHEPRFSIEVLHPCNKDRSNEEERHDVVMPLVSNRPLSPLLHVARL